MKFIASKKLSNNTALRTVMIWMLITLTLAMVLSLTAKSIDYGTTPAQWKNTILGNEAEFIDPLNVNDLLLAVHTDLFELILVFILIASLIVRTPYSIVIKMGILSIALTSLLLYPSALLMIPWLGASGVMIAAIAFILFHILMIASALNILFLLLRRKL
ncbi:MAG: hypothetical protein ACXWB0_00830 [Sulfuricurvum sp.]